MNTVATQLSVKPINIINYLPLSGGASNAAAPSRFLPSPPPPRLLPPRGAANEARSRVSVFKTYTRGRMEGRCGGCRGCGGCGERGWRERVERKCGGKSDICTSKFD